MVMYPFPEDSYTDELYPESERPGCARYIMALAAFLTLLAFAAGLFRNYWNDSTVRFMRVRDQVNKSNITRVNIFTSSSRSENPSVSPVQFKEKTVPFNVPIRTGECTLIMIEAEGYHNWEQLFCPSSNQRIEIEIELVPEVIPPGQPNLFET